ncbi:MAG: hypothetical protein J7K39_12425, partial [Bacteroidales bacterium]|nr:hypothetical protein [Bacteroidales bacterium]
SLIISIIYQNGISIKTITPFLNNIFFTILFICHKKKMCLLCFIFVTAKQIKRQNAVIKKINTLKKAENISFVENN